MSATKKGCNFANPACAAASTPFRTGCEAAPGATARVAVGSTRCCTRSTNCAHTPGDGVGEVVTGAGFTRFAVVARTPFNIVIEARP